MLKIFVEREQNSPMEIPVSTTVFPGGELHVTAEIVEFRKLVKAIRIVAWLESAHDIMELLLATDALRRQVPGKPVHLTMAYVPYARQDRVANSGEALSIKVFADLINAQDYATVTIVDPHSDVTPALLERCITFAPTIMAAKAIAMVGDCALVCPDAGARKRVHEIAKRTQRQVIHADKMRNTLTGEITGTSVEIRAINAMAHSIPLLVIDDICDGGRTFIELAKELRLVGYAGPLHLYVTHGIFSKGVAPLLEHYELIFTTRDWTASGHANVVIV